MAKHKFVVRPKTNNPHQETKTALVENTGFELEVGRNPPIPQGALEERKLGTRNTVYITKSIKMTPELSKKIKLYSAINDVFESDFVAAAVETYLAGKNFQMPKN